MQQQSPSKVHFTAAESPSNHPASVATAGTTFPLSSTGQSTLKLSSTNPFRRVPMMA